MAGFGYICLLLALAICAYGIGASLYGVRAGRREFSDSGRRAVYALAGVLTRRHAGARGRLPAQRLRLQHRRRHLQPHDAGALPGRRLWSSQEGSLLLWAWLLSLWSSLALFLTRKRMREVAGLRDRDPARLRRLLRRR